MPKSSIEASTRVMPISMLRRTRNLVNFGRLERMLQKEVWNLGSTPHSSCKGGLEPWFHVYLSNVPLPYVPVVTVGRELWLVVGQAVRRGGHVRAIKERHDGHLVGHQQLERAH